MILRHHRPAPPLSDFIDLIWHYECDTTPHRVERVLPTGDMGIIINLRDEGFHVQDEKFEGAILCGAQSEFLTIDTAQQAYTLGVSFKPGGALPFLKIPAGELHGIHLSLRDLWGATAAEMREQLLETHSVAQRFRIVEETLLARMKPVQDSHPAICYALREMECAHNISDLASRIGLSSRRFTDVFREQVGLTPKLFCRIRRFQRTLRCLGAGRPVEWADFALANGYYDQPHFIHDFQAFSGMSPSAYIATRPIHINHVPFPD